MVRRRPLQAGTNSYQLPDNAADPFCVCPHSASKKTLSRKPGAALSTSPHPALAARLDELRAALERRHVLLVDEAGSGKSTTLDKIVETLG